MHTLEATVNYLSESTGELVAPEPWEDRALPHFLRQTYRFYTIELFDRRCLLMVDRGPDEHPPSAIRKHVLAVESRWQGPTIYVRETLPSYKRKRLVEHKIAFVSPSRQMYLLPLGIDFREHVPLRHEGAPRVSPATQVLILRTLLRGPDARLTATVAAEELGYSTMTMGRAFKEIAAAGLGTVVAHGRERRLTFEAPPQEVWQQAQSYLQTPVEKRIYVEPTSPLPTAPVAGLTALAEHTMIAPPSRPTFAITRDQWRGLSQSGGVTEVTKSDFGCELEVWRYAPRLLSEGKTVDRLSLYLSLRETDDERIEAALDELLQGVQW